MGGTGRLGQQSRGGYIPCAMALAKLSTMGSITNRSSNKYLIQEGFEFRFCILSLSIDFCQQLLIVLALDGVVGKLLGGDLAPGQSSHIYDDEDCRNAAAVAARVR